MLLGAFAAGWSCHDGRWTVTRGGAYDITDARATGDRLGRMLLSSSGEPTGVVTRLIERATTDPLPGVRRRAVQGLVQVAPTPALRPGSSRTAGASSAA